MEQESGKTARQKAMGYVHTSFAELISPVNYQLDVPLELQQYKDGPRIVDHHTNYDHVANYLFDAFARLSLATWSDPSPQNFYINNPVFSNNGTPSKLLICSRGWFPPGSKLSTVILDVVADFYAVSHQELWIW